MVPIYMCGKTVVARYTLVKETNIFQIIASDRDKKIYISLLLKQVKIKEAFKERVEAACLTDKTRAHLEGNVWERKCLRVISMPDWTNPRESQSRQ